MAAVGAEEVAVAVVEAGAGAARGVPEVTVVGQVAEAAAVAGREVEVAGVRVAAGVLGRS